MENNLNTQENNPYNYGPQPTYTVVSQTVDNIKPFKVIEHKKAYRVAAFISYIFGFLYIRTILWNIFDTPTVDKWAYLLFGALFVAGTEVFARFSGFGYDKLREKKNSVAEPIIYIACVLLQSAAITIWDYHKDWDFYQFMLWHFTIIYYVLARCGALAAGRSGILFLFDCLQGLVVIPWSNIILRTQSIWKRGDMAEPGEPKPKVQREKKKINYGTIATILVSVVIALVVCAIAFGQLIEISETFRSLGDWIVKAFDRFVDAVIAFFGKEFWEKFSENFWIFVWSVPVSCWLFGLVAGCLKERKPPCSDKQFEENNKGCHKLPAYSAYIIIGSVCVLYAIFFGTALYDFINHKGLFAETAHEASVRAVGSFWSLIRVVILNFSIIGGSCLFSKKALWEEKKTRTLATVLLVFALAFAVLAACNLCGVYIAIFGLTPRRLLSSWVVGNVIVWCILMITRLYKKIPAAQLGIILAAVSFSVIVCFKF